MIIDTNEYIDAVTAAHILGISRATMSYHCKAGSFQGTVQVGRYWLLLREAVENYVRGKPGPKPKGVEDR